MRPRARKASDPDTAKALNHNRELLGRIWRRKGKRGLVDRDSGWTHGLSKRNAPYPLTYDLKLMDFDDFDTNYFGEIHGRVSIHDFGGKPPKSSLDLGCGRGTAVLQLAQQWPHCTFVGMDLVHIQPDPRYLKPPLDSRVRWVHGNFLETLPFRNKSFDHVRLSRIAMAVPENKWDFLFEEITRVLKPGGVVEILEENLLFPCGSIPRKPGVSPQLGRTRLDMGPPLITPSRTGFPRTESIGTDSYTNTSSSALPTPEPPMSPTNARPRPSLHLPMHAPYSTETEDESIPMVSRHGPASSGYFGADSGYGGSNLSSTTYKSHSTTSSSSKHNGENALGSKVKKKSRWMYETITSRSREPPHSGEGSGPAITTPSVFHNTPPHRPKLAPHPRDHSILKAAYEQVFAERFINPNPLSILPYYLTLHLQNVKSLPPIQFHLPGPSTTSKQHPSHSEHHVHVGPNKPSTQSPTTSNPGPSTPISPPPHHTHSAPSSASKPRTRARAASVTTPGSASASLGMSNNRSSLNPSGISRPKYDSASPSASIPPNPLSLPQQRPTITPLVTSQIPKSPSTTSFDESLYSKKSASRSGADSKPPSTAASRSSNIGVPPSPARSSTSRRSSLVNGIPSSSTPPPPVPPLQPLAHRPSISSTGSGAPRSNRSVSGQQIGGSHSDAIKGHGRSNSQEEYISALHLARAFQTIVSCKDEIRRQFMLMEDDMIDELLPKYSHASNADSSSSIWDDAGFSHQQHRSRGRSADEEGPLSGDEVDEFDDDMAEMTRSEMFDFLWRNYELDMKDRISMGNVVHDNIGSCIGSQNVKDPAKAKQSNAWKARIERADWRMENMSLEEKKTGVLGRPPLGVGYGYRKRAESAATTSGQNYEISRMVRWFVAFKEEGPKSTLESDALTEDEDDMAITFAKRTSSDEDVTSTDSESGL